MSDLVTYELTESVATIKLDDGKVNALSLEMQSGINAALDEAVAANAVAVILGREGRFSAGFDLKVLTSGGTDGFEMLRGGFLLAERLLSFPTPVVIGCTGHAIAMGSFLLLSGDYRIGAEGAFKIQANETAIGMTLPAAAIEITRHRLAPAHYSRALILAEAYAPDEVAIEAGWLDRVVPAAEVVRTAQAKAAELAAVNMAAHKANKQRTRAPLLSALRQAIESEMSAPV
jgi:enoyl-CoA hydratase